MKKVILYSCRRKNKIRQRRFLARNLRENSAKNVHFDNELIRNVVEDLSVSISRTAKNCVDEATAKPFPEKEQEDTLFSCMVKGVLTLLFVSFGVLLALGIFMKWSSFWTTPSQKISTVILLLDCLASVALGISIWREKDRNYLMSIFSALVAFAALVVTLAK